MDGSFDAIVIFKLKEELGVKPSIGCGPL